MSISAIEAKALSDNGLDAAYAIAYDGKDVTSATVLGLEILNRLQSVWGFVTGAVGYTRFPLYNDRGHFNQVEAAQTSVSDSAANVANSIGGFSLKVAVPLIAVAVVVFIVWKKIK